MSQQINPVENFVSEFEAIRSTLSGDDVPWLDALRRSGIEQFKGAGLPGPKVESWNTPVCDRLRTRHSVL